jgi:hypothetical protein
MACKSCRDKKIAARLRKLRNKKIKVINKRSKIKRANVAHRNTTGSC